MHPPRTFARFGAWPTLAALAAVAALSLTAPAAQAGVTSADAFFSTEQVQTGSTSTSGSLYFFASRVVESDSGDVDTATLTFPGSGSPATLTANGTTFTYQTDFYPTLSGFESAFPTGTYTDHWSGGSAGSGSASMDVSSYNYATDTPLFTAATYGALTVGSGLDPAVNTTLSWDTFDTNTLANDSAIFVTITDAQGTVFASGGLSAATTSLDLAADTLAPDTAYNVELDFSSRNEGTSNTVYTTQGFDDRTELGFETGPAAAAPEPSEAGLLAVIGLGLAGLVWRARRRAVTA